MIISYMIYSKTHKRFICKSVSECIETCWMLASDTCIHITILSISLHSISNSLATTVDDDAGYAR